MFGLTHLLASLAIGHLLWAIAYVTGTLVDPRAPRPQTQGGALTELVARTAGGLALWGLGAFALGLVGWLNVWGIVALLAAAVAAGRIVHGNRVFGAAFWVDQYERVGAAWTAGTLVVYYVALAGIVVGVYPDATSDGVRYHLAYAADWAVHGRIYTDIFLPFPFYANNFLLIYAMFDVLHLADVVHVTVWLCGMLAVLGSRAAILLVDESLERPSGRLDALTRATIAVLVPLAVALAPPYLRWVATSLVDVPIACFAFIPILCGVYGLAAKRDLRWTAVVCAAFVIGMKGSLFVLVPLYAVIIWVTVGALGGTRHGRAAACAIMLLLASPWYLRNAALDHDPMPPLLNVALHQPDAAWTPFEISRMLHPPDLATQRDLSASALLTLPYRFWADPLQPFREYGNVALNVFLYVPVLAIAAAMLFGVRTAADRATVALAAGTAFTLGYILITAYLGRYMLIIEPQLAACVGALALRIPALPAGAIARVAIACATLLPSPGSSQWYREYLGYFQNLDLIRDADTQLATELGGFNEMRALLATPQFQARPAPRVLLLRVDLEYYLHRAGVETVGGWLGPGRYSDFLTAIENDRTKAYLDHFDIRGVIMYRDPALLDPGRDALIRRTLAQLGFHVIHEDKDVYAAVR
jgi:hypothetical protein